MASGLSNYLARLREGAGIAVSPSSQREMFRAENTLARQRREAQDARVAAGGPRFSQEDLAVMIDQASAVAGGASGFGLGSFSKVGRAAKELSKAETVWKEVSGLRASAKRPELIARFQKAEDAASARVTALREIVTNLAVAGKLRAAGFKLPKAVDTALKDGAVLPAKGLSWLRRMSKIAGLGVLGVAAYQGGSAAGRYAAGQTPEPPDPVQAAANRAEINRRSAGGLPSQTQQSQDQGQGLLGPRQGPQQPAPEAPMNIAQTLQQVYQDRYGQPPADGGVGYGYRMGPAGYRPNYAGDYRAQVLGPSTNDPRLNRQYQQQLVEEQQGLQNAAGLGSTLGQVDIGNTNQGLMQQRQQYAVARGREPLQRQLQAAKFALLQQKNSTDKALALIMAKGKQDRLTGLQKARLLTADPDALDQQYGDGL